MRLRYCCAHECVDRPNLPCPACDWSDAVKFEPGQIVATPGAFDALRASGDDPLNYLTKHLAGDWGEVDPVDRRENELSVIHGFRILSSYTTSKGTRFWIITEADRSVTTFLLPEEY